MMEANIPQPNGPHRFSHVNSETPSVCINGPHKIAIEHSLTTESRFQATSDYSMALDMSELIVERQDSAQTIGPTLSDEDAPLRCHVLGCPEQQLFYTKSALK